LIAAHLGLGIEKTDFYHGFLGFQMDKDSYKFWNHKWISMSVDEMKLN
jgi:hypothetical protein